MKFTTEFLLPKSGILPEYNKTFYKTELIANAIMFLDTKKTYAYKQIAIEGKIIDPPVINYTGIDVVRTNVSKFTQDFIKKLVEELALNNNITTNYSKELNSIASERWKTLKEKIEDMEFQYIGIPCKWGLTNYISEPAGIVGMRLYNTLTQTDTFKESTSGFRFPINIKSIKRFTDKLQPLRFGSDYYIQNIPLANLNYLTVPYSYNRDQLKGFFKDFFLEVNLKDFWDILYSTSAKRISETIKSSLIK